MRSGCADSRWETWTPRYSSAARVAEGQLLAAMANTPSKAVRVMATMATASGAMQVTKEHARERAQERGVGSGTAVAPGVDATTEALQSGTRPKPRRPGAPGQAPGGARAFPRPPARRLVRSSTRSTAARRTHAMSTSTSPSGICRDPHENFHFCLANGLDRYLGS